MHSSYHVAVVRFLAFLAVSCALASIYAGPGMFLVWLLTAYVLLWFGGGGGVGGPPRFSRCPRKTRRTKR